MRRLLLAGLLVVVAMSAGALANEAQQDEDGFGSHGMFVASDGLKIHYIVAGRRTPVVLIHGYTGSAEGNWFRNGIAEELAKDHWVVAIDCRGHGDSEKPDDPAKYGDRLWMDVVELMDHLNIEKAHIHGYSMGGGITAQLLARHPERFITAAFGGSGIPEVDEKHKAETPKDAAGPDPQEAEARSTLQGFAARSEESSKALAAVRQSFAQRTPAPLDLTTIKIPVLAINGEFDAPNAKTHRMQRELVNFQSVVLPGKSHLTAIMAGYIPKEYVESLAKFVRENDPK